MNTQLSVTLWSEDWISISQILIALGGVFFAIAQWRKNVIVRRAEFVGNLFDKLQFNDELRETMYEFDYGEDDWYSIEFHRSEREPKVDRLFGVLNYICFLKGRQLLEESEFAVFQYRVVRVCQLTGTKKYLWNLYHFSRIRDTNPPFIALIDLAIEKDWFPRDFKTNDRLYERVIFRLGEH